MVVQSRVAQALIVIKCVLALSLLASLQIRNPNRKLCTKIQRQIQQSSKTETRMSGRPARKDLPQHSRIPLLTDPRADENRRCTSRIKTSTQSTNPVPLNSAQIRITPRDRMWPWFPTQVLETFCDHECGC